MQKNILNTISPAEIGQKLQRVRKRQGITQAAAAEMLGVARTTITAIEKGERRIKTAELLALSNAYGQPVGNFLSSRPMIEPPAVLFRSNWSKGVNPEASQHIQDSIEQLTELATNYYELEQLTDTIRNHYHPRLYRYSDVSGTEQAAESLAISERNRLGLGDRPIQRLRALLEESAGLRIFYLPLHSSNKFSEIYFFDQTLGGCIAINHSSSAGRCRWSLAHAYAHFLAHRNDPIVSINISGNGRKPESEHFADSFAEFFLMPTSGITQCFNEIYQVNEIVTPADLVQMANAYGVSFEALVIRLEGMKLVPKGIYDRLKNRGFQADKAKTELRLPAFPESRETLMLPERYVELAMQAYDEEEITESQLANFLQVDRIEARDRYIHWEEKAEQTGRNLDVMQLEAI